MFNLDFLFHIYDHVSKFNLLVFVPKEEYIILSVYGMRCMGSNISDGVRIYGPETATFTSFSSCPFC